jgi:hypothetical protein
VYIGPTRNVFDPGQKLPLVGDAASGQDFNSVNPIILTPTGALTVDGGDALLVAIDKVGHDCVFGGHLVNDVG